MWREKRIMGTVHVLGDSDFVGAHRTLLEIEGLWMFPNTEHCILK